MSNPSSGTRLRIISLVWLLLLILCLAVVGCGPESPTATPISFSGQAMGTLYTVKIVEHSSLSSERLSELQDSVTTILADINRQMSTYNPHSEISEFNRSLDTGWIEVSSDFAIVVDSALNVCRLSNGALDITVAPLVNLWGFGPEHVPQRVPSQQQLDSLRQEVGYDKLEVNSSGSAIRKQNKDISCDLASVAKGYAVDRLSHYLSREGYSDHLVEIGGEIKAVGKNAGEADWLVGIKTPDSSSLVQRAVALHDRAIATSGSYLNYFEKDGVRYSHLIDPRTGYPIQHHLVSVSVVHESCLFADAMATAISVAGQEEGFELATQINLAAFLIVRENDRFVELMTPAFEELLTAVQGSAQL